MASTVDRLYPHSASDVYSRYCSVTNPFKLPQASSDIRNSLSIGNTPRDIGTNRPSADDGYVHGYPPLSPSSPGSSDHSKDDPATVIKQHSIESILAKSAAAEANMNTGNNNTAGIKYMCHCTVCGYLLDRDI